MRQEGLAILISQKGLSLLISAVLLQPGSLITVLALQTWFGYLIGVYSFVVLSGRDVFLLVCLTDAFNNVFFVVYFHRAGASWS